MDKKIAIGIFISLAVATIFSPMYVHAEPTIVYLNKCTDESTWDCLNKTQAAKRAETRAQVNQACRSKKCPVIFSVDPWRPDKDTWVFGARLIKGKLYFAAMPGCPNGRRNLEAILRRLK